MASQTPTQALKEARQIAKDHGMFVVEKPGKFHLYRKSEPKNIYLGFRSDIGEFRRFVERCAYKDKPKYQVPAHLLEEGCANRGVAGR